jgi:hypothetical protein
MPLMSTKGLSSIKVKSVEKRAPLFVLRGIILFLVVLMTCSSCLRSIKENEQKHCTLNFKNVIESGLGNVDEYDLGKDLFPEYLINGLPESFLIKKSPDLIIGDDDIMLIRIQVDPYSNPKPAWNVIVHLRKEASERMGNFSKEHLKKRVVLEIDGQVVSIGLIDMVLSETFSIGFTRVSLSDLENTFKKVTNNIRIEKAPEKRKRITI